MQILATVETATTRFSVTTISPMAEISWCPQRFLGTRIILDWRSKSKTDKPIGKTLSPKWSHSHLHTTAISFPPDAHPGPLFPLLPVPPWKRGQSWTKKQGIKTHLEMHSTGLLQGQFPDHWLADSSLHICPVCPRLVSSKTRPCCPRCYPAFNKLVSQFMERP